MYLAGRLPDRGVGRLVQVVVMVDGPVAAQICRVGLAERRTGAQHRRNGAGARRVRRRTGWGRRRRRLSVVLCQDKLY
jgi:hypothetical protein